MMKCPSCGKTSKTGTVVCPKCGRYCGRTFASKNEEVFSSSSRTPQNGGYTQQARPKKGSENTDFKGSTDNNRYDDMFFSTNRKQNWGKDLKKNGNAQHKADSNPYDNSVYKETEIPSQSKNETHTSEFVAEDIVKFRKHRFARDLANLIEFYILGVFAADLICLAFDLVIDTTRKTAPILYVYTFILFVFSLITKKTYSRFSSVCIAVFTTIYTVVMMIAVIKVHSLENAVELFFIYFPIAAQDILCVKLMFAMSKYHDHWEAYKQRGIYIIEDEVDNNYEIYEEQPDDLN